MLRISMIVLAMVSMFGCASKGSVSSVQSQLDSHVVAYTADKQAQEVRDARQDTAIAELYAKLDRVFAKK